MPDLPDGAVVSHSLTVTSYLTREGESAYVVETSGDATMTSYLGLLVVAQQQILHWNDDEE